MVDGFSQLATHILADLSPVGWAEQQLTARLISITWRLARLQQIETSLLSLALLEIGPTLAPNTPAHIAIGRAYQHLAAHPEALTLLYKQVQQLERAWDQALAQLLKLQDRRELRANKSKPNATAPMPLHQTKPESSVRAEEPR